MIASSSRLQSVSETESLLSSPKPVQIDNIVVKILYGIGSVIPLEIKYSSNPSTGKRHTVPSNWSNKKVFHLFVFSLISYAKTEITHLVSWTKKSLGKVTVPSMVQSLPDKTTVFSAEIDRTRL